MVGKHQERPIYFSALFAKHIHCNSVYVCCFLKDKCFSNPCSIKISLLSLKKKVTTPESQPHWKREDRRTGFDDKGKRNVFLAGRAGDGEPALPQHSSGRALLQQLVLGVVQGGTVGAVSDMMNMEFFINVTGITLTVTASQQNQELKRVIFLFNICI